MILTYIPNEEGNEHALLEKTRNFISVFEDKPESRIEEIAIFMVVRLVPNDQLGQRVKDLNEEVLVHCRKIIQIISESSPEVLERLRNKDFFHIPLDERGIYIGSRTAHGSNDDWQVRNALEHAEALLDLHLGSSDSDLVRQHYEELMMTERIFEIFRFEHPFSVKELMDIVRQYAVKSKYEVYINPDGSGEFACSDSWMLCRSLTKNWPNGMTRVNPTVWGLPCPSEESFLERIKDD